TSAAGRACHHGPCRSRRVDCPAGCRMDSVAVTPSPCPPPRRAFSMTGKLLLGWLALFAAVLVLIHICPAGGQDANPGTAQLGRLPLPPAPVVPPAPSAVPEVTTPPSPFPAPAPAPTAPPLPPAPGDVSLVPPQAPAAAPPTCAAPPPPLAQRSPDELLDRLAAIQKARADLDKEEQAVAEELRQKVGGYLDRMKKLGVSR